MSSLEKDAFLVYLPTGGTASLNLPEPSSFEGSWYNPRTGKTRQAPKTVKEEIAKFRTPDESDWVLILKKGARGHRDKTLNAEQ